MPFTVRLVPQTFSLRSFGHRPARRHPTPGLRVVVGQYFPLESSKGFIYLSADVRNHVGVVVIENIPTLTLVQSGWRLNVIDVDSMHLRYVLLCVLRFVTHRNRLPLAVSMIQSPCPVPVVLRLVPGLPSWSPRQCRATTPSSGQIPLPAALLQR